MMKKPKDDDQAFIIFVLSRLDPCLLVSGTFSFFYFLCIDFSSTCFLVLFKFMNSFSYFFLSCSSESILFSS